MTDVSGTDADQVARDLGACRRRGLENLDLVTHNQHPLVVSTLDGLVQRYAAASGLPAHGRVSQLKALLRDAIARYSERGNEAEAQLISDLFFGSAQGTVFKLAGELFDEARANWQEIWGDLDPAKFRTLVGKALLFFATYLIEYVSEVELVAASPSTTPSDEASALVAELSQPISVTSSLVHFGAFPIELILQFARVDPGGSGAVTIDEHRKMIAERGACWWGWFKADYDLDHTGPLAEMRGKLPATIGLWVRRDDAFIAAQCAEIAVADRRSLPSPNPELTPAYYRESRWPAWFRFTAIDEDPVGRLEMTARFGREVPATSATILWRSTSTAKEAPFTAPAVGTSILHLSDLHFGVNHRWNTNLVPLRSSKSAEEAIARTLELHEIAADSIGVVVICGNFSSDQPTDQAFHEARAFIEGLCGRLSHVKPSNVVIVPGAEDFERPSDRNSAHQTAYRHFHDAVYGQQMELDLEQLRRYEFEHFRLNVLPINSVKFLGDGELHQGLFGRGYDSALHTMLKDYLAGRAQGRRVVNVVATHHHLIGTVVRFRQQGPHELPTEHEMPGISDARGVLQRLKENKIRLFLHGHLHDPEPLAMSSDDGWQFGLCGSGSAGAAERLLRDTTSSQNHLAVYTAGLDRIRYRLLAFDEEFLRYPVIRDIYIRDEDFNPDSQK